VSAEPIIVVRYADGSVREFSALNSSREEREAAGKIVMEAVVIFHPSPCVVRIRTDRDEFSRVVETSLRRDGSVRQRVWLRLGRAKIAWDPEAASPIVDIT